MTSGFSKRLYKDKRPSPWDQIELIREELFGQERLEQHAQSLALAQKVDMGQQTGRTITQRLCQNHKVLLKVYQEIACTVGEDRAITPAAEWLLDNYHIVDEQLREIHDDLPPGYYHQLPKLTEGHLAGYPRVLGIAWAYVAHTDSRFDPETLCQFVEAYQSVQPLTIGELWAVAITLRILLVENLRRAADSIALGRAECHKADMLADKLLQQSSQSIARVIAQERNTQPSKAFSVQLILRLRDADPKVAPALGWLESHLAKQNTTMDEVVHQEHQKQGATNITVRNIIMSMRLISDVDWTDLFERVSLVDRQLQKGCAFAKMDFPTRNLYRNAIETLAKRSHLTEQEVTDAALLAAKTHGVMHTKSKPNCRACDPGYYLISTAGRPAFEKAIGYRLPIWAWPGRLLAHGGIMTYGASIGVATVSILALPWALIAQHLEHGWRLGFLALGVFPAMDMAMALVNRLITGGVDACILPSLRLRDGIPLSLRTMVVVPTLLTDLAEVQAQVNQLEIHYLASAEGEIHFALLSDWVDADTESTPGDAALLEAAQVGIDALNQQYGLTENGGIRFFVLHRHRVWNHSQGQWMGWERKRGKLHELNRLLRGDTNTTFIGHPSVPTGVRYVITLDSDTRLPLEAVRKLVGKMAHPLNQAVLSLKTGRVEAGYGILQPRVTPSLPMAEDGSLFQRLFSISGGIDPYAGAVSDVYQDLLEEGSYAGKGIYDVDAFEAVLAHRIPENTLLSHDLFEGIFARSGLVSDIEVLEAFPGRYDESCARQHRWARGDWQLLPWLFGSKSKDIPLLGRWKIADNLRRTVSPPACLLALIAGLCLPVSIAWVWVGFVVLAMALPSLLPIWGVLLPRQVKISTRNHLRTLASDLALAVSQVVCLIAFLPHQAWLMADAILRTGYRLLVSHHNLLQWVTAARVKGKSPLSTAGFYRQMQGTIWLVLILAGLCLATHLQTFVLVMPILGLWLLAPVLAFWVSRPLGTNGVGRLNDETAFTLRRIARETWRFFETFVTPADNMLPPDNFQETPSPILAHRTSPTNLGLYLLSAVSARDFGWAGLVETVDRLEATMRTMQALQQFRGHFFNWYDTQDLRPLSPWYISSVDSGNLAGHLIALANACKEWRTDPTPTPQRWQGILDEIGLTQEALLCLTNISRSQRVMVLELQGILDQMTQRLEKAPFENVDSTALLGDLLGLANAMTDMARALVSEHKNDLGADLSYWAESVLKSIIRHHQDAMLLNPAKDVLNQRLLTLETTARQMSHAMGFGFLFDDSRKLLSIGYLVNEDKLDESCYDLLASEARLASFFAIAKGDVPAQHWFRLGRSATPIQHSAALISWSGSMFEYLMPSLVMQAPFGSLLEQTNRLIVARQMTYADSLGIPWGISESAYNIRDRELTYQYSNFGVPGLGLKRGLSENRVVAPYATALAAMVNPLEAARNFKHIKAIGGQGRYGFYEALDYTPTRLPEGEEKAVVAAYMAHHQGMSIVSLANALLDGLMRARFHVEPMVQAADLLLQEKSPRDVVVAYPRAEEVAKVQEVIPTKVRRIRFVNYVSPESHLLSNGRYTVMLTGAGSGYSQWNHLAVTRWHSDVTRDDWGAYVFLRDCHSGDVWSAGHQPCGVSPLSYNVTFTEDRAQFVRRDGLMTTTMDILVSSEDDAEVRRVTLLNQGFRAREIDVTSYAEVVLAPPASDRAHPAFSKLFIQTYYDPKTGAIMATRRQRAPSEPEVWAAHLAVVEGQVLGLPQVETDRARFLGRGHDIHSPLAIIDGRPLSNTVGPVLDPVFALRHRVHIPAGGVAQIAFWTITASSKEELLDLIDKHRDAKAFERATTLAWTQAQVQLHHLGLDPDEASLFQRLGSLVCHPNPAMRLSSEKMQIGVSGPQTLWAQGISGDNPLIVVRIDSMEQMGLVRQVLRAHEYLRMKQLAVDLVILNERVSSYVQDLQLALEALVRSCRSGALCDVVDGQRSVFALRSELMTPESRNSLLSVARVVLDSHLGSLAKQLMRPAVHLPVVPHAYKRSFPQEILKFTPPTRSLEFFNGLGGFSEDGQEYVTILGPGQTTPAPWVNVVANPQFGFQVSAEGSGYTWALNSKENQLTPWSNDPVSDRPGEVLYIRDEDTGVIWTPTALPIRNECETYTARHGQGYSQFEHTANGIELDLLQYVPRHDAIKISRLMLKNTSSKTRRLTVTAYVEWVLGAAQSSVAPYVITQRDSKTGALFAQNPWNHVYAGQTAFMDLAGQQTTWTGDRREFVGRNGTLENPVGLVGSLPFSQRLGAGLDPCGVLQMPVTLKPDETIEVVFFLGQAESSTAAQSLIMQYRQVDLDEVFNDVGRFWADTLGTVQVKTPDRSMDLMLNRWLLYQTLVCRMWARSAFYQASGAYGFRDQLQDTMALTISQPALAREHILRAAGRQFLEGDVQHWWLPDTGQGVRTQISDDRVWLAYITAYYVKITGDKDILDEVVPFLDGPALAPGQHDVFFNSTESDTSMSLYEHCELALKMSLRVGPHGLPLIGTGDWNDGMNRVGEAGRGESVWLGWLLLSTLKSFIPLAQERLQTERAAKWQTYYDNLKLCLEKEGWDGDWYRRGYFDDGTPLGSASNDECQIDSIAQSWSVLSGGADPARAAHAMAKLQERLINSTDNVAMLFTPAFDKTALEPGYIKGYPPGIRENGGQYTHAATWSVMAYTQLGQGDKAGALFSLLNPVNHTNTRAKIQRYKVEPYVVAADVYTVAPHIGRGGWTWYTGAAGWLYRAGIESILGFKLCGDTLQLNPCIPAHWPGFEIVFQYHCARYVITVENPQCVQHGVLQATLDEGFLPVPPPVQIQLDKTTAVTHQVRLVMG